MYKQKLNPVKTSTWNWRLIRYYETYNASYHDILEINEPKVPGGSNGVITS